MPCGRLLSLFGRVGADVQIETTSALRFIWLQSSNIDQTLLSIGQSFAVADCFSLVHSYYSTLSLYPCHPLPFFLLLLIITLSPSPTDSEAFLEGGEDLPPAV